MKCILAELRKPEVGGIFKDKRQRGWKTIKARLYERVTREFNETFKVNLSCLQVRYRIVLIIRQFNEADELRVSKGPGPVIGVALRKQLSKICFYYFDLEDLWSAAHNKQPRPQELPTNAGVSMNHGPIEARPAAAATQPPPVPIPERLGSEDGLDTRGDDSHEPVKEEEGGDIDVEGDDDEEETLTRTRPHLRAGSGNGKQPTSTLTSTILHPVRRTNKPTQRQKTPGSSRHNPQEQILKVTAEHQQRDQRERSTTPAPPVALPSGDVPELPTREHGPSIAAALERFMETSLSLVTLHTTESKHRQDLALKQQELEYHLNLKRIENEHEIRKLELQRDMEIRKQEHEKEMMAFHLKSLDHSQKESQAPRVIILEDKMNRYVLQATIQSPSRVIA